MELVGTHEIRLRLGRALGRQRVYQLTQHSTFPPPLTELAQGKIWDAAAVDQWIRTRRRHDFGPSA